MDRRGADRGAGLQQGVGGRIGMLHQCDLDRLGAAAQGQIKRHALPGQLLHQRGIILGQRMLQGQAGQMR
ncbi:hypothetical protein G6F62_015689 [Rhizopus arrhizus]|nr:hypothetical protein G6F23_015821 [Rhizopus arrhizus]KAG1244879.1 hypothetical protein G6F65_021563 [Rhizopus arrhizus]KAG1304656.1 hypothetical protein G6F62_015689 [Rhizopus arrhizus]KAG1325406.1 hypothetical protein G6F61_015115 [Rhizopus arrhizus]KAG1387884.1 hypothetical protein G6F58_013585 [Rhizopus delemar]